MRRSWGLVRKMGRKRTGGTTSVVTMLNRPQDCARRPAGILTLRVGNWRSGKKNGSFAGGKKTGDVAFRDGLRSQFQRR